MRSHGTRAKYTIERCRCDRCRTAHREYNRQWDRRQRRASYGLEDHNPAYIDASEAIAHIHWLRSKGVGKRTIAKAAGIGITSIDEFTKGIRTKARLETIHRILAVGTHRAAGGAHIDADPAWRLIDDLLLLGFTKTAIAAALGSTAKTPALQLDRHRITKTSLDKVQTIWTELVRQTEAWHGTYYGYARKNCRCIRCRKVMRDYTAERRAAS